MAEGRKTGGKDWVKGQSGNPNGRPPVPASLKEALSTTKGLAKQHINTVYNMSVEDIKTRLSDPTVSMGEKVFMRFFLDLYKKSNVKAMDLMLRMLGIDVSSAQIQMVENYNVQNNTNNAPPTINVQFVQPESKKGATKNVKKKSKRTNSRSKKPAATK